MDQKITVNINSTVETTWTILWKRNQSRCLCRGRKPATPLGANWERTVHHRGKSPIVINCNCIGHIIYLSCVCHFNIFRFLNGNNTIVNHQITRHAPHCFVRKSLSMPNLKAPSNQQLTNNHQLNVSQAVSNTSNDSFSKMRTLLPMYPIPMTNDSGSNSPAVLQNSSLR